MGFLLIQSQHAYDLLPEKTSSTRAAHNYLGNDVKVSRPDLILFTWVKLDQEFGYSYHALGLELGLG